MMNNVLRVEFNSLIIKKAFQVFNFTIVCFATFRFKCVIMNDFESSYDDGFFNESNFL
jgi:hypothetical protein